MKNPKSLFLIAVLFFCLSACEKNTNDDLLSYTTSEAEGQIVVDIDGEKYIFRDSQLTDSSIPIEVANFTATIKEVRNDGQLLVTFVDMDDMFVSLADGDYVVDGSTLETDFSEGDSVRIWFDGSVEEVLPAILPNVYKIELDN
ncbi:hypothetical protein NXH64_14115 [Butyrivibrio fibrisolvens]|uniref:hypothetical protein n=1 Tax=Pseudobutyrivibrio ruminis TaxID=46206 RepID=UPI0006868EEE|nr:hypothetical protein [Pseudobutyrivibrio ruminis]MDC7280635.1 hypothetical protein [Butyrivibrio fibrisolvens]